MEKMSRARKFNELERFRNKSISYNGKSNKMNPRANSRQLMMDKKTMERRNYRLESSEEEDDEDEDGDTLSDCTNERVGLCVTCNLAIVESNDDASIQKPLLCHRCIKRLDSQTDTSCTFGQSDSQYSATTFSQDSTEYYNERSKLYSTRTYNVSHISLPSNNQDCGTNRFYQTSPLETNRRNPSYNRTNSMYEWQIPPNDERRKLSTQNHDYQTTYHDTSKKEGSLMTNSSEMKINFQTTECSRRPIRCPRMDCAVNVAFSALTHHFLFDHPEVPVISVDPGVKSTVVFGYSTITCDSSRCLALLLVSDKLPEGAARLFNGSQIHIKYRNRLPLPILAARLRRKSLYTNGDAEGENIYGEGDVIIIWIAGLDVASSKSGSLQCSIQAVDHIDNESLRSLTYTGPINSLRTAQCPREVLINGDCLILHEGFVSNVTSGNSNLNVNLIVH